MSQKCKDTISDLAFQSEQQYGKNEQKTGCHCGKKIHETVDPEYSGKHGGKKGGNGKCGYKPIVFYDYGEDLSFVNGPEHTESQQMCAAVPPGTITQFSAYNSIEKQPYTGTDQH